MDLINVEALTYVGGGIVGFFALIMGALLMVKTFYRKVSQGQALVNNKMTTTEVYFTGGLVWPVIHKAEVMDISLKTVHVDRRGADGLVCKDNIRADINVAFFVRVNKTAVDVKKVAQIIGCERASEQQTIEALFSAKFSEALKTVGYRIDFVGLYDRRDEFKSAIVEVIGHELNGYILDDVAIDYLEQTPVSSLDRDNILDAEGIRKITASNADAHIATNERENFERQEITRQNVTTRERILDLERQQAEAEANQRREVEILEARAGADIRVKVEEERARSEQSRIAADEGIALNDVEMKRKVEVAEKGRERVVGVEEERVKRERNLEAIDREKAEALGVIAKNKALEVEKKAIADVLRERVAVDKTVAQEEEHIKDLRADKGAERDKRVTIVGAEAQAEKDLVQEIKSAEAKERAASHLARERVIAAEAELEATDKETRARIRRAEGTTAESAATGLGAVRVKEADAAAHEKQGMVNVRVKAADADSVLKMGDSEAQVTERKMLAEAAGVREQGLARVHVQEQEAQAIEKRGVAEGAAVREKLVAEAAGLAEKASAMKALDESGRGHEEYRLNLEKSERIEQAAIEAQQKIAEAQAEVLGEAFKNTKIDIVGGDGEFFERFIGAVGMGKSIDGLVDKSKVSQAVLSGYLDGSESLSTDITKILAGVGTEDLQRLSVAAVLGQLARGKNEEQQAGIAALLAKAKELGIDKLPLGQ